MTWFGVWKLCGAEYSFSGDGGAAVSENGGQASLRVPLLRLRAEFCVCVFPLGESRARSRDRRSRAVTEVRSDASPPSSSHLCALSKTHTSIARSPPLDCRSCSSDQALVDDDLLGLGFLYRCVQICRWLCFGIQLSACAPLARRI